MVVLADQVVALDLEYLAAQEVQEAQELQVKVIMEDKLSLMVLTTGMAEEAVVLEPLVEMALLQLQVLAEPELQQQ
jgi:hypothetical protein